MINTGKGRALSDQLGTVREALDRMVNVQARGDMRHWIWSADHGVPFPEPFIMAKPLHIAAGRGHSYIVAMLLDYGPSINGVDMTLGTALHYAAANGKAAMIELLLDSGANPNALNSDLASPCMAAALYGHVDSIQVLMNGGGDSQQRDRSGHNALHLAARCGAKDAFIVLMNVTTRPDLGAQNAWGRSILYDAISQGWKIPMSCLLNLAPPAGAYESRADNILNAAIEDRSMNEVRMLIRRIPNSVMLKLLNYRALGEGTPLHLAAVLSKLDTLSLLLDAGAQLELEGSEHGTPLMAACAAGRLAAVRLLVARGARTSYVKDGQTFSAFLAAKYHPEVRRWLLVGRFLEGPKLLTYSVEGLSLPLR